VTSLRALTDAVTNWLLSEPPTFYRDVFKFREIRNKITERVQDRYIVTMKDRKSYMAFRMAWMPMTLN